MKKYFCILIIVAGCKEVYNPAVKNAAANYLVVEGNIGAGNDSTFIYLSRSTPVADTSTKQPETNATVKVESKNGNTYQLQNFNNGVYYAAPLNINPNENYRLHIFTANGKEYASDYVPVKITPAIDSVSWNFDETGGIEVHVSTHDATNNSRYYRWQYVTTYEHRSVDSSWLIYDNGALRDRLHEEQIYRCYNVDASGEIFIASTAALASDVVFQKKLASYPYESPLFRYVYSMNVTQYALTKEAYEFWDNLKKNTEQLGSIFDPQPFAEYGNIHCISDTSEPVLGFISACSSTQQRIYIYYAQVHYPYIISDCPYLLVSPNDINEVFSLGIYSPLRYELFGSVSAYETDCLDCRSAGGTNVKPPYMP